MKEKKEIQRCQASVRPYGARIGNSYACGAVAKASLILHRAPLCLRHHNNAIKTGTIVLSKEAPMYNNQGNPID